MVKIFVIPADAESPITSIVAEPNLATLQGMVGGYIEAIYLPGAVIFGNEEGKLEGLPVNGRATLLAKSFDALWNVDFLVGNVALLGYDRDTDVYSDVPETISDLLK